MQTIVENLREFINVSADPDNMLTYIIEPLKLSALDFIKLLSSMCYEHTSSVILCHG